MNQKDVMNLAEQCNLSILRHSQWTKEVKQFTVVDYIVEGDLASLMQFADLVAFAEREKLQGQIETLNAMYEVVVKQRDYLMDQQRAQVEAMRGRVQ